MKALFLIITNQGDTEYIHKKLRSMTKYRAYVNNKYVAFYVPNAGTEMEYFLEDFCGVNNCFDAEIPNVIGTYRLAIMDGDDVEFESSNCADHLPSAQYIKHLFEKGGNIK